MEALIKSSKWLLFLYALVLVAFETVNGNHETISGSDVVVAKKHTPADVSFLVTINGVVPANHPESWGVCFRIPPLEAPGCLAISREIYDDTTVVDYSVDGVGKLYVTRVDFN